MQEKIPWIEANYKHYFRKEKLYLLLPSFSASKKKKKQKKKTKTQTRRMSYRTCSTGQFFRVRNSLILLHKFSVKSFLKER